MSDEVKPVTPSADPAAPDGEEAEEQPERAATANVPTSRSEAVTGEHPHIQSFERDTVDVPALGPRGDAVPAEDERLLVLVVEADLDNLGLLERVLESTGRYRTARATDGVSGLEQIRRLQPAMVLLDLDLPLAGGLEIFRRVKSDPQISSIPVVAVSASVMKGERRRCLDAGFAGFIEKPFDIQMLRRMAAQITRRWPWADGPQSPAGT